MMEWQPIETAPKDGTDVLIYDADDGEVVRAFYGDCSEGFGRRRKPIMAWCFSHSFNDEMGGYETATNATHWMPLPEPPSQ